MDYLIIFIVVVIVLLCLVYLIRNKVVHIVSKTLHLGFIVMVLVALSALFLPQIYRGVADFTLTTAGTYQNMQKLDTQVNTVIQAPQNILDAIGNFLTGKQNEDKKTDNGFFVNSLYPSLVDTLGFFYRIFALILSIAALVAIIYFSYNFQSVDAMDKLKHRVDLLEKELKALRQGTGNGV
jgi:hypothetical protein